MTSIRPNSPPPIFTDPRSCRTFSSLAPPRPRTFAADHYHSPLQDEESSACQEGDCSFSESGLDLLTFAIPPSL